MTEGGERGGAKGLHVTHRLVKKVDFTRRNLTGIIKNAKKKKIKRFVVCLSEEDRERVVCVLKNALGHAGRHRPHVLPDHLHLSLQQYTGGGDFPNMSVVPLEQQV